MFTVYRRKISLLIVGFFLLARAIAQPNLEQFDLKPLHFGFTLATNVGMLQIDRNTSMHDITNPADTMMNILQKAAPGLGLGAITNLRLGKYFDLRLMAPVISFVDRSIQYEFPNAIKTVKVESAYCDASLLLKYKSARRKNMRVYVIGGPRFSYDFGSTIHRNRGIENPVVSLNPITYGYELGFGFDFYFEFFKFSTEIKNCQTYGNAMYKDGFIYTNYISSISPQLLQISLHFE